jgi:hypothetical protein
MSGRAMTARRAFEILSFSAVAAVARCWISSGPSSDGTLGVGVGAGSWPDVLMRRLRSLWRSGRTSKVAGGGRAGTAGCSGSAGVTEPVGGSEAEKDTMRGVVWPDMMVECLHCGEVEGCWWLVCGVEVLRSTGAGCTALPTTSS